MTSNNYCVILKSRKEESGFGKRPEDPAALERSAAALPPCRVLWTGRPTRCFSRKTLLTDHKEERKGESDVSFMVLEIEEILYFN